MGFFDAFLFQCDSIRKKYINNVIPFVCWAMVVNREWMYDAVFSRKISVSEYLIKKNPAQYRKRKSPRSNLYVLQFSR